MDNRIHIAFGFHVNCYHSYRGDTPDEKGFGSDIRIIRGILGALDALNAASREKQKNSQNGETI